jgi:hypothetical protein
MPFVILPTNSASGGYDITNSLRFNSGSSDYLSRTPSSATNRKTFTISSWFKRSKLGALEYIIGATSDAWNLNYFLIYINSSDQLNMQGYTTAGASQFAYHTTQVFRDVSAWYHIMWMKDTTQATDTNRMKLYVNGVQVTAFSTASYPTLNSESYINNNVAHHLGTTDTTDLFFNGYMTEVNFIDGQALTPSSFGETNAQTGVWQPKAYSGSYGTNGFYLNFSDNSNTTAATLGKDYSGNGNNWTPNNFSVTAGVGNDSLVDSPTSYGVDTGVGGTVRGNYCTLNPLATGSGKVLVNGNLEFTSSTSNWYFSLGTIGFSSGKYYWEVNMGSTNGSDIFAGIMGSGVPVNGANGLQDNATALNTFGSLLFCDDGKYQLDGNLSRVAYSTALGSNQTLGIAVDMDAKSLTFYKDNVSQGAISFSSSPMASSIVCPSFSSYATGDSNRVFNFGQRPFAYTAPSGFKALCTQNLPTPTIGATTATQAGKFFNTVLYTGNSSTLAVTGVGFQPDWVWGKCRSTALSHRFFDAVRGVTNRLISNNTSAETSESGITAFNSDGFTLGSDQGLNFASDTYVAWNWKANGAGSSNTAGSITSTVSANTTSGFSIVTYSGQSAAGTVGHGLGVVPSMIIVKSRSNSSYGWAVWHSAFTQSEYILMDTTDAKGTASNYWNSSAPSTWTSAFGIGTEPKYVNNSGDTFVAYCFAEIAGYSKFGTYTGNGSADGPFVYCGFKPAFVMAKVYSGSANQWLMTDDARNPSNVVNRNLNANEAPAEVSAYNWFDYTATGFKLKDTINVVNANGAQYIFMAFAEVPTKFALAR